MTYRCPERRRAKRHEVTIPIEYRLEKGGETITIARLVRNIGAGGLCFQDRLIPENTPLKIKIFLPFIPKPIEVQAKVVWTKKSEKRDLYDIGITFQEIEEEQIRRIMRYVGTLVRKSVLRRLQLHSRLRQAEKEYRSGHLNVALSLLLGLVFKLVEKKRRWRVFWKRS